MVGNDLYAGGDFTEADGLKAYYLAKWDGSQWSELGSGLPGGGSVFALATSIGVHHGCSSPQ